MSRKQNFILIQPKNKPLPLRKTTMITIIKTRSLIICSFVWWFSCIALPSYQLHSVYQKIKPINYVPQPSTIKTILFKTQRLVFIRSHCIEHFETTGIIFMRGIKLLLSRGRRNSAIKPNSKSVIIIWN